MSRLAARCMVLVALAAAGVSCSPTASDGTSTGAGAGGKGDGPDTSPGDGSSSEPGANVPGKGGTDAGSTTTSDASTGPVTNGFPTTWIDGTACGTDPALQTWKYAEGTYILRQSLCTTFEGPFLYLFVGAAKALLVDTGTGGVDLRGEVTKLLAGKTVQLVVAHSHGHGDHVGGDGAFKNQPGTTVVGTQAAAVKQFFGSRVTRRPPSTSGAAWSTCSPSRATRRGTSPTTTTRPGCC